MNGRMKMRTSEILYKAANELNIQRTSILGDDQILYSVLGRMALSSLMDVTETTETGKVSVQHVKKRIKNTWDGYKYHECRFPDEEERDNLAEEIYRLYYENGYMYHERNYVRPAVVRRAVMGDLVFERKPFPDEWCFASGLACFSKKMAFEKELPPITELLEGDKRSNLKITEDYLNDVRFRPGRIPESAEFLRETGPFYDGYWMEKPYTDGRISMMRVGTKGFWQYSMYSFQNNTIMLGQAFSEWMIEDREIYQWGIIEKNSEIPVISYQKKGVIIAIKPSYLLPDRERRFYELITWPIILRENNPFQERLMHIRAFQAYKEEMEKRGYVFRKEEQIE